MAKHDDIKPEYLSVRTVAVMLSIDPSTVYRLIDAKELNAYQLGPRRKVVKVSELDDFMNARRTIVYESSGGFSGR